MSAKAMQEVLATFRGIKTNLGPMLLQKHQLICKTGTWKDSSVLKLQKANWTNDPMRDLPNESGIFFSIWLEPKGLKKKQLFYNIHALKLRKLRGYSLTSGDFAESFRHLFSAQEKHWPNISTDYGPQTLFQGCIPLDMETLPKNIGRLIRHFIKIAPLIDRLLQNKRWTSL